MATSQSVNVLRWSALVFGVFYGFSHQRSLTSQAESSKIDQEYKHKESLIAQAKAEWAKKNSPPSAQSSAGEVITDPEHPNFDLEKALEAAQ